MSNNTNSGPLGPNPNPQSALTPAESRSRLAQHMQVLNSLGHTDLSALGKLTLSLKGRSEVAILQRSGVLLPSPTAQFQAQAEPMGGTAMRSPGNGTFQSLTGGARVTASVPLPSGIVLAAPASVGGFQASGVVTTGTVSVRGKSSQVTYPFAYWFATEIILEDDTTVVLAEGVTSLVIIAEKLTIGKNVTLSWERPKNTLPSLVPSKPGTPPTLSQADSTAGERGIDGIRGTAGGKGTDGRDAPSLELWCLAASGFPVIDMRGQDGFIGVRGGDGGDGGGGQMGCNNAKKKLGGCLHKHHSGGNGGNGAASGDGGPGGDGGDGGTFSFFAPQALINSWLGGGITISVDGGNAGPGGDPGLPGIGGPGGKVGQRIYDICFDNDSTDGQRGNTGPSGNRGPSGIKGNLLPSSIQVAPITPSDFFIQAAKPAIMTPTNLAVFVGDTVTVVGKRFAEGDQVLIRGFDNQLSVACPTTLISTSASDSTLTFVVPNIPGGIAQFQIRQTDGTLSANKGGLIVKPKIEAIYPQGRIRAGKDYFIRGTGLGFAGRIWIKGEDIGPFSTVDKNIIKFKAKRPSALQENPSGENAKLKVVNSEGTGSTNPNHSAEVDIVFDTYRLLVFGDSVLWGGGLPEHQKFYSLAADYLSVKLGNAKVHKTIKAHHGAKIGRGDTTVKPEIPGELSTRWPTILQQVDTVAAIPDAEHVDLIIMGGGANDLPITDVMLVSDTQLLQQEIDSLVARTRQYCKDDMTFMLQKVLQKFPNAKVIVTGYYHIFSEQSNPTFLQGLFLSLVENVSNFPGIVSAPEQTRAKIIALSNVWVAESNKNLAAAVDQVNADPNAEPRTFFVNPATQPSNAAHAPNSFLWEPTSLGAPTDPMWENVRKPQRDAHEARLKSESGTIINGWYMTRSNSSYHPNPAGAQNYFDKMKPALDKEVIAKTIALKASNGRYLTHTWPGTGSLSSASTTIGNKETFDLIDLGSNKVALKATNGRYVSVAASSGAASATKQRIGANETFTLVTQPSQQVALKAFDGRYLSNPSGTALTATATAITAKERFSLL